MVKSWIDSPYSPFKPTSPVPTQRPGSSGPVNEQGCFPKQDWENTTDPENRPITWVFPPPPDMMYLVADDSTIYKEYIDRYFLFFTPEKAIDKAKKLGFVGDLESEQLQPGIRLSYHNGYTKVWLTAVKVTK